jgi:GTPase SAR1 family protein
MDRGNAPAVRIKKVTMIGAEGGVGKTAYRKRLHTGVFEREHVPTLGST